MQALIQEKNSSVCRQTLDQNNNFTYTVKERRNSVGIKEHIVKAKTKARTGGLGVIPTKMAKDTNL